MAMKPAAIELHIDELILDSGASVDDARLGEEVRHELSRLVANGTAGSAGGASEARGPGGTVAAQIAQAVYRRIQT